MLKTNGFDITGKLIQVADYKEGQFRTGQDYVSVKIVVANKIDDADNEYTIELFASKLNADKSENKLYDRYRQINNFLNHRVRVQGQLKENRFYSNRGKKLVSNVTLAGRFVNEADPSTLEDHATFEFGGFVVRTPEEKKRKDGTTYAIALELAQANYSENNLNVLSFLTDPSNAKVIDGINNKYKIGDTVQIEGKIVSEIKENVVMDREVAFGDPIPKKFKNRTFGLYILSGNLPLAADDPEAYNLENRTALIEAYKAQAVALESKAAQNVGTPVEVNEKPQSVINRQTSLL